MPIKNGCADSPARDKTDLTWRCIQIPENEVNAHISEKNKRSETAAQSGALSKIPVISSPTRKKNESMCGGKKNKNVFKNSQITEKNTVNPESDITAETLSVTACANVDENEKYCGDFCVGCVRLITTKTYKSADNVHIMYTIMPFDALFKQYTPTNPITNVGVIPFVTALNISDVRLSQHPFLYASAHMCAPDGAPHTSPVKMMPTRFTSAVRTSNLHTTENGKTAGIRVATQNETPRAAPSIHTSRSTANNAATDKSEKKIKEFFFVFTEFSTFTPPCLVIIFIRHKYYYIRHQMEVYE